ncbi:DUF748 domain-containing protein [Variovorax rhizosphaerae]|uniref:DUF748 domain-containing protein n=1 Tax=Variovorax rhizosphaerae TaxID=1836200 RepID=UPI003BF4A237
MNAAGLRQNKWVRRVIVAVLTVLLIWLVAWLVVPPLLKSQLQNIASAKLGRQVTVGKIDFKPWTMELALNDLHIATADGKGDQLAIKRIYVDAEMESIVRLAPVVDAVTIDQPTVALKHLGDGHYDIDDIIAKLATPPDKPPGEPPRFAIYNIAVNGGSVDFDDQAVQRKHTLRDLVLNVPFISNLASLREAKVEPKLAFTFNGSKFDSAAATTPFAESRKTDAQIQFKGLDLVPYLGYVPAGMPVQLKAGSLDADVKIDFERATTAGLKISGTVATHGIRVADGEGRELLAFDSLTIGLTDIRPLERVVHLGEIALVAPNLAVARDAAGKLNLLPKNPATGAPEKPAPKPDADDAAAVPKAPAATPWKIEVDKFALSDGNIGWHDETVKPAAGVEMTGLGVHATGIQWPMEKPASFSGGLAIGGAGLKFEGQGTDKAATVKAQVEALPLSLAAPYLAQSLEPTLDGKLGGEVEIAWTQPELKFKANKVSIDGLALSQGKTALASVGRFELTDAVADMTQHTLAIGTFSANQPKVRVERDKEKRWMFERWLKTPSGNGQPAGEAAKVAAPKPTDAGSAKANPNTRPWGLTIGNLLIDGGAVSYADDAASTPVAVEITALKVSAQKLAPNTATSSPLEVSGRIGAGRSDPGKFLYKGNVVLKPVSAEGRLEVGSFPVHAFKAYYSDALNVDVRRAFASYRGTVNYAQMLAGMSAKVVGDLAVDDLRINSVQLTQSPGFDRSNNQLLGWKTLGLRGLQVTLAPSTPPRVDVRETSLTDFFARVIVDPTGRLNLQDLTKKGEQEGIAKAAAAPQPATPTTQRKFGGVRITSRTPPGSTTGEPPPAELMVGGGAPAPAPTSAAPVAAAQPEDTGMKPVINFGPMSLVNGKIDFTDLFVKPNYSADLSELTGKLSAFSSNPPKGSTGSPELADLELRGKAQQTASLEITGKLNPLAKPLELDITAKMRELDLAPLSPYSAKYAGHGIERGKMSMDVNYKIAPDGQLIATNKLILNQLQFGDEVPGATRTLPVRLAVALLADRNGVIDVDLPLRGSLNDPQFSIGPLIWKAIVNLIVKAATAPFALLTGGGGGGGDGSSIVFDPGSATLNAAAKESLDKIAKAMIDKPGLRLTVSGTASLEQERIPYQKARLRQLTQAEKRRVAVRAGKDAAEVSPVTDAEYPDLLTAIYKRADITKPRNMVGLARDLPVADMENLMITNIPVDEEVIRQLAVERGGEVRDYLLAQKVPTERLFLGAVRVQAGAGESKPGAELKLDMR